MKRDRRAEAEERSRLQDALNPSVLLAERNQLPNEPGCYKFYDTRGKILYIGKAKDLKKRVNSYFTKNRGHDFKTHVLVGKISRIEYVITNSEHEALLLENNLIKQHQPPYNLMLKDGKSYPYIVIKNERFPRVFHTRKKYEDGSLYFGPYPNYNGMRAILTFIRENFKVRTCSLNLDEKHIQAGKYRPCLEYHIKKCKAPCVAYQSEAEYNQDITQIKHLLRGHFSAVQHFLKEQMKAAAEDLDFERAAELKTRLDQVQQYKQKATVVSEKLHDLEVVTIASRDQTAIVNHFKVEKGTIVNTHAFTLQLKNQESPEEVLAASIRHLASEDEGFAQVVVTNKALDDAELSDELKLEVPQIGDKRKLVDLSLKNCFELLREKADVSRMDRKTPTERKLEQAQKDLRLVHLPRHIECFDNSNIQGYEPVASCVVFKDAAPSKRDYRTFKIKTVVGPDDFASMKEVVGRRYRGVLEREEPLPDLIVIDGGKGQLSHAIEALDELGLTQKIPIIGIAKCLEEIYYMNDPVPLYIDKKSSTLKLIQHLRNEAHRFAITFHRKRRDKATLKTELTDIPGIGPKLAQDLLSHFGSVKKIQAATQTEISEVVGMSKAALVYQHFQAASTQQGEVR